MKYIISILMFVLIGNGGYAAKVKKPKRITVDKFEGKDIKHWIAVAKERKKQTDGSIAIEDARNDKIKISLSSERYKYGKHSMKIEYKPSGEIKDRFAMIVNRKPSKLMDGNNTVSFWVVLKKGKGEMVVRLIDKTQTTRFYSKPIKLEDKKKKKRWKRIKLTKKDFSVNETNEKYWSDIHRIGFDIKGDIVFYIDHITFTTTKVKHKSKPKPKPKSKSKKTKK